MGCIVNELSTLRLFKFVIKAVPGFQESQEWISLMTAPDSVHPPGRNRPYKFFRLFAEVAAVTACIRKMPTIPNPMICDRQLFRHIGETRQQALSRANCFL